MPVIKIEAGDSGQMMLNIKGQMIDVGLLRRDVSNKGFKPRPKGLPSIARWYCGSFLDKHTRFGEFFDRDNEIY